MHCGKPAERVADHPVAADAVGPGLQAIAITLADDMQVR
jgi:hypothetical protein